VAGVDVASIGGAEGTVAGSGGAGGFAVDVEGRRALSWSTTVGIGGSTGGPTPDPASPPIGDGTEAIVEAGSVRLIRSPEISSSRTASHAQRMRRAQSSTSGKRMRKCSSWTTSVKARTAVAKKARVSVELIEVGVVEDGGAQVGEGRAEEEEEEGGG